MEMEFGVKPEEEHYTYVVEMLSKAGKLKEAIDMVETMHMKLPRKFGVQFCLLVQYMETCKILK